jgi:hypothetical protein
MHVFIIYLQTISLNSCKEKAEWVESNPGATTHDFIEQKELLEEILGPILLKLTEPRKYIEYYIILV